jgi:hypothetical protein
MKDRVCRFFGPLTFIQKKHLKRKKQKMKAENEERREEENGGGEERFSNSMWKLRYTPNSEDLLLSKEDKGEYRQLG